MKIKHIKEKLTSRTVAASVYSREVGHEDILWSSKKLTGKPELVISNSCPLENINLEYCKLKNITVTRSEISFGPYGNIWSIPGITFAIYVPKTISFETVMTAFTKVYEKVGEVTRSNNDLLCNGKKVLGTYIGETQNIFIGSIEKFPDYISGVYTDWFLENSNKIAPIDRVGGYNDFIVAKVTMEQFITLVKAELPDIEDVEEVDGNFVPDKILIDIKAEQRLLKTDYKSLSLAELIKLKERRKQ